MGPSPLFASKYGCALTCTTAGRTYDRVLPDPVAATATRLRPERTRGHACACTGEGSRNPALSSCVCRYLGNEHSSKERAGAGVDVPVRLGASVTVMPLAARKSRASASERAVTSGCSMYRSFSNTGRSAHASGGGGAIVARHASRRPTL